MREGAPGDGQIRKLNIHDGEASYAGKASNTEAALLHDQLEHDRAETRRRLDSELIENTEGLQIARVDTFLKQYGLPPTTARVFDETQFAQLKSIMGAEDESESTGGMYDPYTDIVVVFRNGAMEKDNGTGITETIIVHESVHSTASRAQEVVVSDGDITQLLQVQVGEPRDIYGGAYGDFYEEALAEFMAYLYARDVLELPDGFGPHSVHYEAGGIVVPGKYAYSEGENGDGEEVYKVQPSSLAAYGLELLLIKLPELFPLLLNSRYSPKDRQRFIQKVNALSPGLYQELRNLSYTKEDFNHGVWLIIEQLYNNDVTGTAQAIVDDPLY